MRAWLEGRAIRVSLVGVAAAAIIVAQGGAGRGGRGAAGASGGSGGRGGGMANARATAFDPHDLSGYWELGPEDKSIPAADLAPGVTKAVLDKMALEDAVSLRWCRPLGLPAVMDNGRPLDIQQGKWEILIAPEANASPRHLYFNRPHIDPNIFDPASMGDSIAHWEGETLIVDTIGFHPKDGRMLIPGGGFRTEKSHLVERYKLLKNGTVLSVTFTWTDPKVFRTPHTYEYRYTKAAAGYEPRMGIPCDPFDAERTEFIERAFTPAQKAAAEAASIEAKAAAKAAAAAKTAAARRSAGAGAASGGQAGSRTATAPAKSAAK